jgi:imidazolonepropionase-like amidohydrolase
MAVVGGTLVDIRTGQTTANATVLIDGDRIAEVGPGLRASADAKEVDARGGWLIPGLTDMHAHVRLPALLPVYLAFGVTTVRDPGGNLTRSVLLRRDVAERRRIGPRMFIAGSILDGIPPLWPEMTLLVDTVERAEAAVRFLAAQEVDFIKVYNSVPDRSLETIVRIAHDLGMRVTGHVPRSLTMTRAIEIGIDGLEHVRVTGREMLSPEEAAKLDYLPVRRREAMLWERFDLSWPKFAQLVDRIAKKGVFLDPTFVVDAAPIRTAEERDRAERMDGLPAWIAETVRPASAARDAADPNRVMEQPPDMMELGRSGFRKRQQFIRMCATAGVRLVTGTDHAGLGDDLPGRGVQQELRYLAECGLSPLAALQASTLTAAAALGKERETGAIERGMRADILVVDKDPLADVRNVAAIRAVVHGGRATTPAELLAAAPAEPETPYAR